MTIEIPASTAGTEVKSRRRLLYLAKQASIVVVAIVLFAWLAYAIRSGLARNGISFDMGFLSQSANFDISEGELVTLDGMRKFVSSDTNAQALFLGLLNTLKTSLLAIAAATVLGVFLGIARVSQNWLVRQLSFVLVEFVRNTPMLIQLVFWYFAVVLRMPALNDATLWLNSVLFSQQGLYFPGLELVQQPSLTAMVAMLLVPVFLLKAGLSKQKRIAWVAYAVVSLVVSLALGFPLVATYPEITGFNVSGGFSLSPEIIALLLGLSVYTAAFLAEIVRGSINAIPKGQWEAAAALGLTRRATFKDVLIPQVARVVLPAFGNQYISLAKSTSLGIAIGFSDLFNVYGTVANQSGRSLEGMIVVMVVYLLVSWMISWGINAANKRLLKKGGAR
ncbi:ABC transporter permease subunit [Herbaspirillum sp. DW155]|uniref:ABC transporter permease subunit n=1 Tax=Herbaspirillum sp. DW155 TaxID=3095609 RepID=UPI003089322A|nr:ABC transporter permease subunit [Herbaspirillum sp. DW155]